jgi:hypothetical protein
MTVLAASLVLVVLLTVIVAVIAATIATTTTSIRRVHDGAVRVVPMSECRTNVSSMRTLRMLSALGAALWAQRRALTVLRWTVAAVADAATRFRKITGARDGIVALMHARSARQLGDRRRLANQRSIVTVLAASLVLVVVLTVALIAAKTTTGFRRVPDGVFCVATMSDCRTTMSVLRTLRMLSLLGASLWTQRRALTITPRESTTSDWRDTRPVARSRSPCSAWSEPATEFTKNKPPTLHRSPRPAIDQPSRRQDSTTRGTSPTRRREM